MPEVFSLSSRTKVLETIENGTIGILSSTQLSATTNTQNRYWTDTYCDRRRRGISAILWFISISVRISHWKCKMKRHRPRQQWLIKFDDKHQTTVDTFVANQNSKMSLLWLILLCIVQRSACASIALAYSFSVSSWKTANIFHKDLSRIRWMYLFVPILFCVFVGFDGDTLRPSHRSKSINSHRENVHKEKVGCNDHSNVMFRCWMSMNAPYATIIFDICLDEFPINDFHCVTIVAVDVWIDTKSVRKVARLRFFARIIHINFNRYKY